MADMPIMLGNLLLCVCSAFTALVAWPHGGVGRALAYSFGLLSLWQLYCACGKRASAPVILRLGGFDWDLFSFCRGWLITGQVGTGKTAGAINTMLWQVSKNCPGWGGLCVDDKGLYWETLSAMLGRLRRASDLILLQVRPENAGPDWHPAHKFNFLDNPYLPFSAKAKIVCDVAASLGQRNEQSFFRMQAQVQMEFAFKALACGGYDVTFEHAYEFLSSDTLLWEVMDRVDRQGTEEADSLVTHFLDNLMSQPKEQLGGVKTTVENYLKCLADPAIAEVFCPKESTFRFEDIDRGKIICLSMPQRYAVERRYISTLLKLTFYTHALRRFDKPAAEPGTRQSYHPLGG